MCLRRDTRCARQATSEEPDTLGNNTGSRQRVAASQPINVGSSNDQLKLRDDTELCPLSNHFQISPPPVSTLHGSSVVS